MKSKHIKLDGIEFSNSLPFVLLAGPCQLESLQHAFDICGELKDIAENYNIPFVFKSSFDKANRTSLSGKRGLGIDEGLDIFREVKKEFNVPVITDVHLPEQCKEVAEIVDILQIPAFLCRQTDLLLAAGNTGKVINVKKGQFLAPWDMSNVAEKISSTGNDNILLCERGTTFGYNNLVVDMRSLAVMRQTGYPVIFDATHSVQQPSGKGKSTGGDREMAKFLARAAMAIGIAGLFIETHQDPDNAPSDGPNMIRLGDIKKFLEIIVSFDRIAKEISDSHNN